MKTKEIRKIDITHDLPYAQCAILREIATQLAEMNEHLDWITDHGYVRVQKREE